MNMSRRNVLRGVGGAVAAPFAAKAAHVAKSSQLGSIHNAIGLAGGNGAGEVGGNAPTAFTSFVKFMSSHGEAEAREQAKYVSGFDPDLIDMHLPMVTKVRMQRARNYKRNLRDKKTFFERTLSRNGKVDVWL